MPSTTVREVSGVCFGIRPRLVTGWPRGSTWVLSADRRERVRRTGQIECGFLVASEIHVYVILHLQFLRCDRDVTMHSPESTAGHAEGWSYRAHARARLGIAADEIDGGHYISLSRPAELAERLDAYVLSG